MAERQTRSGKKRKKRRGLRFFLWFVLFLVLGVGIYLANVYRHIDNTTDEIYEPIESGEVDPIRGTAVALN